MCSSFLGFLQNGLKKLGFEVDEDQELLQSLPIFIQEVVQWNKRFGLVSFQSSKELVIRHVLDSLAPWKLLQSLGSDIADLGSGAGFPGIPLALALSHQKITLIERSEKRCIFLENVLTILDKPDVRVLNSPFQEIKKTFDLLTFRAFSPLTPSLFQDLRRIASPKAIVAAYKGRLDVFQKEVDAISSFVRRVDIEQIKVPFLEEERHLVLVEL